MELEMDMMVCILTLTLTVKRIMRRTGRTGGGSSLGLGSSESGVVTEVGRWACHVFVFLLTLRSFDYILANSRCLPTVIDVLA